MYVMATNQSQPNDQHAFLKRSSLYQEFLAERDEILRHKWLESERAGEDIGFEKALLDWIRKHRDDWRSSRRNSKRNPSTDRSSEKILRPGSKPLATNPAKRSSK